MKNVDRVDEKLTSIAVNIGCGTPAEIRQAVSDLYRAITADDNLQILEAISRTGVNTVHRLLKVSREVQRELANDNALRAEIREKAIAEAAKAAEDKKPKAKAKSAGNADAPA